MIEKYTLNRSLAWNQGLEDMTELLLTVCYTCITAIVQMFLGKTVKQQVFCYIQKVQSEAVLGEFGLS